MGTFEIHPKYGCFGIFEYPLVFGTLRVQIVTMVYSHFLNGHIYPLEGLIWMSDYSYVPGLGVYAEEMHTVSQSPSTRFHSSIHQKSLAQVEYFSSFFWSHMVFSHDLVRNSANAGIFRLQMTAMRVSKMRRRLAFGLRSCSMPATMTSIIILENRIRFLT